MRWIPYSATASTLRPFQRGSSKGGPQILCQKYGKEDFSVLSGGWDGVCMGYAAVDEVGGQ